jgi:hypothetical protein
MYMLFMVPKQSRPKGLLALAILLDNRSTLMEIHHCLLALNQLRSTWKRSGFPDSPDRKLRLQNIQYRLHVDQRRRLDHTLGFHINDHIHCALRFVVPNFYVLSNFQKAFANHLLPFMDLNWRFPVLHPIIMFFMQEVGLR